MSDGGAIIEGRVHGTDGRAVAAARIMLAAAPVPTPDVALLTDEQGHFALHVPVPGRYTVACHADDREPVIVHVDVPPGAALVEIDVELTTADDS